MKSYDAAFFRAMTAEANRSSEIVAPLVVDLVSPRSVCDVGCGTGGWLRSFRKSGVDEILGIDGPWVDTQRLQINSSEFQRHDLTRPIRLPQRFDLVVSLEVAEHLPAACGEQFVESLVTLSDLVLFSAAIPSQGGTHHVNEQWPEYWRDRFLKHRYVAIDCIRPLVWNTLAVDWYYAQNMLLYAATQVVDQHPLLTAARARTNDNMLSLVHPRHYTYRNRWLGNPRNHGLYKTLQAVPLLVYDALSTRFERLTGRAQ